MFKMLALLAFLCSMLATSFAQVTLPVLILVPFFDSREGAGYDRGIELIPAARLARDEINQRSDILPGYQLQLIEATSDACGTAVPSNAISNFASEAIGLYGNTRVIGVVGLVCSTVTAAVSPIAGHDSIGLIQMSMASSPVFLDNTAYPHLWRVISTSLSEADAVVALSNAVNWSKIATVNDDSGIFFISTASAVRDRVKISGGNVTVTATVDDNPFTISNALQLIQNNGARIVFVSVTIPEASALMCGAAEAGLLWPAYVWIFHSRTLEELLSNPPCELDILLGALENVILLEVQLQQEDLEAVLVSGITFKEFRKLYTQRLSDLIEEPIYQEYANETVSDNVYANAMYDEMWAFSLALNNSQQEIESKNMSFEGYQFGNLDITNLVEKELQKLSFDGAGGTISFDTDQEAQTTVRILQVRNGTTSLLGMYDSESNQVTLYSSVEDFPLDEFEIRYALLPISVTVVGLVLSGLTFIAITSVLVLNLALSQSREIKATSPYLSIVIFVGFYCLCFGTVNLIIQTSFALSSDVFTLLCYLQFWFVFDGMIFTAGLQLLKLLRIYRIFSHFGKLGKAFSDWALLIYVIIMSMPTKIGLLLIGTVDPDFGQVTTKENPTAIPPFVQVYQTCQAHGIHFILTVIMAIYILVICGGLIWFGYKTRKIGRHQFKDTKTIIANVFVTVFFAGIALPVSFALSANRMIISSGVVDYTAQTLTIWIILGLTFPPKITAAIYNLSLKKKLCCFQSEKKDSVLPIQSTRESAVLKPSVQDVQLRL